ncbi:zinc finger C2HC domain-containing protein 1B [Choristoneura fumiferana]|uniref:zinc finger C2HC domain-containing protein 1B n=1 Tax=Choristoneura fumiferana TaxID=7141 RepID=UPI003D15AC58
MPRCSKRTRSGAGAGAGAGEACAVCARRFAPDRLAKHQEICRKAHAKKRKPFDVLKHRLAGTEAEPFLNKLRKNTASNTSNKPKLNAGWRQKHEEFIAAIRAAKQVQAHLAAGGKLSDLPPPPPSENPDYVPCPHCGRRFNQGAADRHIPKCANFQFNKPKPAATKRR